MTTPQTSPFLHTAPSLPRLMWQVCASLSLGIAVKTYYFGLTVLSHLLFAVVCAVVLEALCLALRRYPLRPALDGSAAVTALLLTLSMPVHVPYGLLLLAIAIAIVLGKQLFGGLGMNPFNPAMLAFAWCLVSFPLLMSQHEALPVDGMSGATVLDHSRGLRTQGQSLETVALPQLALLLQNSAWLLGLAYLAKKRFADLRISISMLLSALVVATLFWWHDGSRFLNPWQQLISGALIFGACFIATDPTTAATTVRGRYLYGALIGALVIAIRNLGQFPDGVAFAVLFANALVPLLDPLTRPHYR